MSDVKPLILALLGKSGSGKTAIRRVVFEQLSPRLTCHIALSTDMETSVFHNSVMECEVRDVPPSHPSYQNVWVKAQSLILVVDCEQAASFDDPLQCRNFFEAAVEIGQIVTDVERKRQEWRRNGSVDNEPPVVDVFLHKMDKVETDARATCIQGTVERTVESICSARNIMRFKVCYHRTSIFDDSILRAMSTAIQRLPKCLNPLQRLLASFASLSQIESVALFDIQTRLCICAELSQLLTQRHGRFAAYVAALGVVQTLPNDLHQHEGMITTQSALLSLRGIFHISLNSQSDNTAGSGTGQAIVVYGLNHPDATIVLVGTAPSVSILKRTSPIVDANTTLALRAVLAFKGAPSMVN